MEHLTFTIHVNNKIRSAFFHRHEAETHLDTILSRALIGDDYKLYDREQLVTHFDSNGRQVL